MSKELLHLFKVIQEDRLEQLKATILHDPSLINAKDYQGKTALIIAAEHGSTASINALIKHGAHINYKVPEKDYTALMVAAKHGHLDSVKYLLENGADVTIKDMHGKTALDYAQQSKKQDVTNLVQKYMEKKS